MVIMNVLQKSLRLARPFTASCVCPRRQNWWSSASCFHNRTFATINATTLDEDATTLHRSTLNNPPSPWLMLPTAHNNFQEQEPLPPPMVHQFYSLADKRVLTTVRKASDPDPDAYCVGSSRGWVGFINRRPDYDFFLSNPMSGRNIKLPSILKLDIKNPAFPVWEQFESFWCIQRATMSSSNPDAEDCRVLVHYQPPTEGNTRLAFCSPGCGEGDNDESTWTHLHSPLGQYTHIAYSPQDQRFFAMDADFQIESWDLREPSTPKRHPVLNIPIDIEEEDLDGFWDPLESSLDLLKDKYNKYQKPYVMKRKSYLVADPSSPGQLFLIHRFIAHDDLDWDKVAVLLHFCIENPQPHKTVSFVVYKIDTTNKTLHYIDSLDDVAIFIGLNEGLVLSAEDYPELKPNSIYFSDDLNYGPFYGHDTDEAHNWIDDYEEINYGGHDIGIYNYADQTIEECYYPVDADQYEQLQPSPVWFTPSHV